MVETKCIKRPPFGIIKIVLNSYCQLIRTVTPNKEEASWQKIIATQVKILRMDSIHRRKKIRVRTEIQHLIQVRIRIPAKILIQIRIRTAQTAIPKMQMTALAEKMIMMSQTDINRYCEQQQIRFL